MDPSLNVVHSPLRPCRGQAVAITESLIDMLNRLLHGFDGKPTTRTWAIITTTSQASARATTGHHVECETSVLSMEFDDCRDVQRVRSAGLPAVWSVTDGVPGG